MASFHQCHGLPDYPITLEQRAYEVQEKLTDAQIVGIVGMGGIGKTTIAKEVFNKISINFEYTCFVDNVKGIPRHALEDWLLRHFHHNGTEVDGNQIQWYTLMEKRTLIIMDDVDSEDQIIILPKMNHFGNGSRLIITSRDQRILKACMKYAIYEVDFLNYDEAKMLFCQHAFDEGGIPEHLIRRNHHMKHNVERVVKKCGGLPLSIEVMSSYLRGHEADGRFWEEAINRLEKAESINGGRNDRLWASLRVSYDALSQEEQQMFIEAGTFFFQKPVDEALAAWTTAYRNSETSWADLLSTSMVKEVDRSTSSYTDNWIRRIVSKEVWVHEQLRDLASNLSKGAIIESDTPYGEEDKNMRLDLLIENTVQADTSFLRINNKSFRSHPNLQSELLEKLEELKYLELHHVVYDGSSTTFLRKLSLLEWNARRPHFQEWRAPSVSLQEMNNLAVLRLTGHEISQEASEALGKLSNLRILYLSNTTGPDRLPESFGNLSQLKRLTLTSEYRILKSDCHLQTLPHSFGNLKALEHLHFENSTIQEFPESFGNLSSLATLTIINCHELASLPPSFGRLLSLLDLTIGDCRSLEYLPCSFSLPKKLQRLDFYNVPLEELGDSFENLSSVQYVRLCSCTKLQRLPPDFGFLSSLEELHLIECRQLRRLPDTFGQLKALKRLTIHETDLEALPDSFGNLSALTYMRLWDCVRLERLPESFGLLSALEELKIGNRLRLLPDNFGQLTALKKLTIDEEIHFMELDDNFENFSSCLYRLDGYRQHRLKILPLSFGRFSSLEELRLERCQHLQRLPGSFGQLSSLKRLILHRADRLEALPESFGNLSKLERLYIRAKKLQSLPGSIGQLHSLRTLTILARSLSSLPQELGNLSSLELLNIGLCERMENLPRSLERISSLREVQLLCCPVLRTVPYYLGLDLSAHGDNGTDMRRLEGGQSSQIATTEEFWLFVAECPLLINNVRRMPSLGWASVEPPTKLKWDDYEFGSRCGDWDEEKDEESNSEADESSDGDIPEVKGFWYQRRRPAFNNARV